MKLIIDISAHNIITPAQFDLFKTFIDGVVIRLSYGVTEDSKAAYHVEQCKRVALPYVGYHWSDCYWNVAAPKRQKDMIVYTVNKYKPASWFSDCEQFWSDWAAYTRGDKAEAYRTRYLPPVLDAFYLMIYNFAKSNLSIPIGNYSGRWFVKSYMLSAESWIYKTNYWDASYINDQEKNDLYKIYGKPIPINKMKDVLETIDIPESDMAHQFTSFLEVEGLKEGIGYHLDFNAFTDESFSTMFGAKMTKTLPVPDIKQIGINADKNDNDCGEANMSSGLAYRKDIIVSPDDWYELEGWPKPIGDVGTYAYQLADALALFDVRTVEKNTTEITMIKTEINKDNPIIALIDYKTLQNANLTCFKPIKTLLHWIMIVGYDDQNIIINDPYCPEGLGHNRKIPNAIFSSASRGSCLIIKGDEEMPAITNATIKAPNGFNIRQLPSIKSADIGNLLDKERIFINKTQMGTDGGGFIWGYMTAREHFLFPTVGWVRSDGYVMDAVTPTTDEVAIRKDEVAKMQQLLTNRLNELK